MGCKVRRAVWRRFPRWSYRSDVRSCYLHPLIGGRREGVCFCWRHSGTRVGGDRPARRPRSCPSRRIWRPGGVAAWHARHHLARRRSEGCGQPRSRRSCLVAATCRPSLVAAVTIIMLLISSRRRLLRARSLCGRVLPPWVGLLAPEYGSSQRSQIQPRATLRLSWHAAGSAISSLLSLGLPCVSS